MRIGSPSSVETAMSRLESARYALDRRWELLQTEIRHIDREVKRLVSGVDPWNEKTERNAIIYELRQQGRTLEEIGEQFGISKDRVRHLCARQDRRLDAAARKQRLTTI